MRTHTRAVLLATVALALATPGIAVAAPPDHAKARDRAHRIEVQLLAINDFHGNLEPPFLSTPDGTPIGGVEYLDTHLAQLEATNPNTLVVSAGDLIGASPLLSGLFHDEPTIEAANRFGLDFNAVGNHEFDEGVAELLRMQEGGCHPEDGCQDGAPFRGADFQFLAANVAWKDGSGPILPPYKVVSFPGRVKVGLIGLTLEGTASIVSPAGIQDVSFADEADTINALVPRLRRQGVETIVVLIHEGGAPSSFDNSCPGISGPIVDIVNNTSEAVDLFVTGHTHQAYNCVIDGRPVTSAYQYGGMITDIDLSISRATKQPVDIAVNNRLVTRDVRKAPEQTKLIAYWQRFADEYANRIVGSITQTITRTANAAGESALGDRIADAQLWGTTVQGAQIAFMNPGGIRADLPYDNQVAGEAPGEVTFGEVFNVQPFQNTLVTMDLTGEQIDTLLEQQFDNPEPGASRILQVSEGFTYTWDATASTGNKVDIGSITLNGAPIDPAGTYRVTVNSFLADGGDKFGVLTQGTNRYTGAVDSEVFADYVGTHSPLTPGPQDRITRAN